MQNKPKYERTIYPKNKKPEDFVDFCKAFHGKQFINTKKHQTLDKWEVWCFFRLHLVSYQTLRDNTAGWIIWEYKNQWLNEQNAHKYNKIT